MSFVPNKNASVESRLGDAEDALALLTDRTEYCFGNLIEDGERTERTIEKSERTVENIQRQVTVIVQKEENIGGVGKYANEEKTSEIFNDYTNNTSLGKYQHVEGMYNTGGLNASCAHLEGRENSSDFGAYSHVEGQKNTSEGTNNHIEGEHNTTNGNNSHLEGRWNSVDGSESHLEGYANGVKGDTCHAEGSDNHINSGARSHVEGWKNTVSGNDNHVENEGNTVTGDDNHVSGYANDINADCCAVFGWHHIISNDYNTVFGKCNVNKDLAFCVGIGTSWAPPVNRKNGLELDWDGNLRVEGDVIARNISPISISDTIDENSTNDRAVGGKAVYDFVTTYAAPIGNVELQAIIDQAVG